MRKLGGLEPQKSCKHVHLRGRWWWWRVVVVVIVVVVGVGQKLSHDLHGLSLGFH
jgi:hypothetical protein